MRPARRGGARPALPVHHYRAYGLRIRSEIETPFAASGAEADPDLTIRVGAVPPSLGDSTRSWARWQVAPGRLLLTVDGTARYLIAERGREVVVAPAQDGDGAVGAFLCGSVLGACLQQRGRLTLHASAVETSAGAVLFAGPRGVGKSTLLAALLDRGYRMLADDVSGIALEAGGRPEVFGAFPAIRLWGDVMERLRWDGRGRTLEEARGDRRKWSVSVERFRAAPLPLRAVFLLSTHDRDSIAVEPVPASPAFASLVRHTYRPGLVRALGLERRHFRMVGAVVRHAPVVRVRRPRDSFQLDALADRMVAYLERPPSAVGG